MARFKYIATDANGKEKTGVVEAVNRTAALVKLRELSLFPSSIEEISSKAEQSSAKRTQVSPARGTAQKKKGLSTEIKIPLPSFMRGRVTKKAVTIFTRQLSTLIDAGVPLLKSLTILERQETNAALKKIIHSLAESVEGGSTFAEAIAQHPKVFDKLFVNMVRAGEVGGVLHITLNRLAEFIEKAEKIKSKVRGAMVYPVVVMCIAIGIVAFMMVVIIPKFKEIFSEMVGGAEMPAITRLVMSISETFMQHYVQVLVVIGVIVVIFNILGRIHFGRVILDWLKLKLPIFGTLTLRVSVSRFARTFGTLLTSGVQILQALNIVRDTAGNEIVARAIQKVHDSIKEGESVAVPMEASGVFPNMVVSMVAVGEETGRLPDMLVKIADNYESEVDNAVEALTSVIEPILIIFLAVVVGTIVVAMFMPLISIVSKLRGA